MYHFAVLLFLGLALFKLVDVIEDFVPGLTRWHGFVTMALAVIGAYALDYNVFTGWQTTFREAWMGKAATGLAVGGMTSCWRAAFHYLGSSEGDAPEVKHPMHGPRSMAA